MKLIESIEDYYRSLELDGKSYENLALNMIELSQLQKYLHDKYRAQPVASPDLVENLSINFNGVYISVVLASDRLMFAIRKMTPNSKISLLAGYLVNNIKIIKSADGVSDRVEYPTNIVAIYKTDSGYEFSDMGIEGVFEIITKSIVNNQ